MIDKLAELLKSASVEKLTLTVELKGAASPGVPEQPPAPPVNVPDPPHVTGLKAVRLNTDSCKVSWSNPMAYKHIYINVYKDGGKPAQVWLDGDATSHTFNDLASAFYRFEVICVVPGWHGLEEAYGYTGVDLDMR